MIFTFTIAAEYLGRSALIMLDDHDTAAFGAFLIDRLVPDHEIAVRILAAAVKYAAPLGLALDESPFAALWAGNPQVFDDGLRIAALWKIRAG